MRLFKKWLKYHKRAKQRASSQFSTERAGDLAFARAQYARYCRGEDQS